VSRFGAGITLDLAEPHLLVPVNLPPSGAHEMLPLGGAIQVTGEEAHTETPAAFTGPAGERWAYTTLHELVEQLPRSTRPPSIWGVSVLVTRTGLAALRVAQACSSGRQPAWLRRYP
jgi:hypothetical protein